VISLVGAVFWLSSLENRVDDFIKQGSPTAVAALQQTTLLEDRVAVLQNQAAQIGINTNRLTKLESEEAQLRRELDAVEKSAVSR
jgi:hypothetical protein